MVDFEITVPLRDFELPGGLFEELFHSEYSELTEAPSIIDTIAPLCPTNLILNVNSRVKQFILTWYYPINTNTDTVQNDIKEFEVYKINEDFSETLLIKTKIPLFVYKVTDENDIKMYSENGIMFAVKAVDYHDLKSNLSAIIMGRFNSALSCSSGEFVPKFITRGCGEDVKNTIYLGKKMFIENDTITIEPGAAIGLIDSFKNKNVKCRLIIKDLNTGYEFSTDLYINHKVKKFLGAYDTIKTVTVVNELLRR